MEKKLQDYIHFYIGQEAEGFWTDENGSNPESEGVGKIVKVGIAETAPPLPIVLSLPVRGHNDWPVNRYFDFNQVKPILRPLSDITEQEAIATYCVNGWYGVSRSHIQKAVIKDNGGFPPNIVEIHHEGPSGASGYCCGMDVMYLNKLSSEQMVFLLRRGFDLFGLIPAGLALDKTKRPSPGKEGTV